MVNDPGLAPDRRFAAAEELSLPDDNPNAAFSALADDPDLDERYRRRAAALDD